MMLKLDLSNYFLNKNMPELAYFIKLLEDFHVKNKVRPHLMFALYYYIKEGRFPNYFGYEIVLEPKEKDIQSLENKFNKYGSLWILPHIKKQN